MNRKGLSTEVLIALVIAVALLVIMFVYLTGFHKDIGQFIGIIPTANASVLPVAEGMAAIGMDLSNFQFVYFSGEEWLPLKAGGDVTLGAYDIPASMRADLRTFYTETPRKGVRAFALPESWRILHIPSGRFQVGAYVYAVDELVSRDLGISSTDLYIDMQGELFVNSKKANAVQRARYGSYVGPIQEWRDEILAGGACEKFISLSFKKDKIPTQAVYRVKKDKTYIYVDFTTPVNGELEKWASCVNHTDPYPVAFNPVENVSIRFTIDKELHTYTWHSLNGKREWEYSGSKASSFVLYNVIESENFYNGLLLISSKLTGTYNDYLGFIGGEKPRVTTVYFDESGGTLSATALQGTGALDELTRVKNKDQLVNDIMTKYYSLDGGTA